MYHFMFTFMYVIFVNVRLCVPFRHVMLKYNDVVVDKVMIEELIQLVKT